MLHSHRVRGKLFSGVVAGLITAGSGLPGPASAASLPPLRADQSPLFSADVLISLDSEGRPGLSVSISLPYDELQWLQTPRGFAAAAEYTVVFAPQPGPRQFGDVWDRRVLVKDFATTNSPRTSLLERRTFDVPPGRYAIRVSVRDLNAERMSLAQDHVDVPDYSKVPVGFADLELGFVDGDSQFRSVPSRRFGLEASRIAARAVLFDRRSGAWPRSYPFQYRITDDSGGEVLGGTKLLTLEHSAQAVLVRPDSAELFIGSYVFEVELAEGKSRWRVDRSFEVEESGPPRGRELERLLEPLSYIADAREIDALRAQSSDEQARAWAEFWQRRDPTPETPRNEAMLEFFRRIRYAERHFQTFGPGWRSDMGRIYIKFGPPDQTESRPATTTSPALEVWYYDHPYRRFVFVDREGFGRFVLASPGIE